MSKAKVGVIGSGIIAHEHVRAYKESGRAEVTALVDIDKEKASSLAKELGISCTIFQDYRELLGVDLDAVSICTPNSSHSLIAIDFLNNGKHVLCEKPMAINTKEAQLMKGAAERSGKILRIAFNNRFSGNSQALKGIIKSGALGEIYHFRASVIRRRGIPALGSWFTQRRSAGGGALLDAGCHVLDLALWFTGFPKPKTVSASTHTKFGNRNDYIYLSMWGKPAQQRRFDVEDAAFAFIRFKRMSAILECSWAANTEDSFCLDLLGTEAGAKLSGNDLKLYTTYYGHIADVKPFYNSKDIFMEEISQFLDLIEGKVGDSDLCTPEQGIMEQKIIDAVYMSAQEHKEVGI